MPRPEGEIGSPIPKGIDEPKGKRKHASVSSNSKRGAVLQIARDITRPILLCLRSSRLVPRFSESANLRFLFGLCMEGLGHGKEDCACIPLAGWCYVILCVDFFWDSKGFIRRQRFAQFGTSPIQATPLLHPPSISSHPKRDQPQLSRVETKYPSNKPCQLSEAHVPLVSYKATSRVR